MTDTLVALGARGALWAPEASASGDAVHAVSELSSREVQSVGTRAKIWIKGPIEKVAWRSPNS